MKWTQKAITRHKMKDSLPYPSLAMQGYGSAILAIQELVKGEDINANKR
jgi:hypothetical protein